MGQVVITSAEQGLSTEMQNVTPEELLAMYVNFVGAVADALNSSPAYMCDLAKGFFSSAEGHEYMKSYDDSHKEYVMKEAQDGQAKENTVS